MDFSEYREGSPRNNERKVKGGSYLPKRVTDENLRMESRLTFSLKKYIKV